MKSASSHACCEAPPPGLVWTISTDPDAYAKVLKWSHRIGPIVNATKAASVMQRYADREDQENAWTMMLDTHAYLRGIHHVTRGSRDSVDVPFVDALRGPSLLTQQAVRAAAAPGTAYVILCHNHPSGDATPSEADLVLTEEISGAFAQAGFLLLDSLVLGTGSNTFYSFREGSLWKPNWLPF